MFYHLTGKIVARKEGVVIVDVSGVGYRIFIPERLGGELIPRGQPVTIFCHLHVRENALDLFGFLTESDLQFFEKLITVSGVGPRSALAVMAVAPTEELAVAITASRAELLTKASGIGTKTAERIIIELRGRLPLAATGETVKRLEADLDLEEALIGLGYSRHQAKKALSQIKDPQMVTVEQRLKAALRLLKK